MIERDSSGVALRHGESERVRPCSGRFCRFRPECGEERPPATRSLFLLRVGHSSRSAKFMSASRDGATLPGELAEVGTRQHRVRVRKAFGGGARGRSRHLVCPVATVGTSGPFGSNSFRGGPRRRRSGPVPDGGPPPKLILSRGD
jgi:hypothetical protein